MISDSLRRIAADSNVLLSAVVGKAALKIFAHAELVIVTTQFNVQEVEEYIPQLARKYSMPDKALFIQLQMLPVIRYGKSHYASKVGDAEKYLKGRDSDDVHLGALALKERIPIWSNDRDFERFPVPIYTTARLLKELSSW